MGEEGIGLPVTDFILGLWWLILYNVLFWNVPCDFRTKFHVMAAGLGLIIVSLPIAYKGGHMEI